MRRDRLHPDIAAAFTAIQEAFRCRTCGKRTDVEVLDSRRGVLEIVTTTTHCACPGGPAEAEAAREAAAERNRRETMIGMANSGFSVVDLAAGFNLSISEVREIIGDRT